MSEETDKMLTLNEAMVEMEFYVEELIGTSSNYDIAKLLWRNLQDLHRFAMGNLSSDVSAEDKEIFVNQFTSVFGMTYNLKKKLKAMEENIEENMENMENIEENIEK